MDWYLIVIKRSLNNKWAAENIILIATDSWYIRWANKTICAIKLTKIPTQYLFYIYFRMRLSWMHFRILYHLRLFSKKINDAKKYSTWLYINLRKNHEMNRFWRIKFASGYKMCFCCFNLNTKVYQLYRTTENRYDKKFSRNMIQFYLVLHEHISKLITFHEWNNWSYQLKNYMHMYWKNIFTFVRYNA